MNVKSIVVSNPIGAIRKIREYGKHFSCQLDWAALSLSDQEVYRDIFGAGKGRLCISLIVPIINNHVSLDDIRLHISPYSIHTSFRATCVVDNYILTNGRLPDYCGIKVKLTAEEKVNLMCLIN